MNNKIKHWLLLLIILLNFTTLSAYNQILI